MRFRKMPDNNYWALFNDEGKTMRFTFDPTRPITPLEYPEIEDVAINSVCLANCPYCFLPGTAIALSGQHDKVIEDIENNDLVFCIDQNNEVVTRPVSQLHTREYDGDIIELILEDGSVINCTPNHKIMTTEGEVKAEDLTIDHEVLYLCP